MVNVTIQDAHVIQGYCFSGLRRVCSRYGIDYDRLVREGIPSEEIEHIDNVLVRAVIKSATARSQGEDK
jgi:hypothetical protein